MPASMAATSATGREEEQLRRRHVYASRTRFIPDGLLNHFNKTAWPVIAAGSASVRDSSQGVRIDAGARVRGMWR